MSAMRASVNRPVDPKVKDRDIENKLRLYGIYNGFANGKFPSNKQIDIALNSFLNSRPMKNPSNKLSPEGRALVADFRDVVEQAKVVLLTKNHDQLLQEFIWHTEQLGAQKTAPGDAGRVKAPVTKEEANRDGQEALGGLRTLGTLILSNGQFRKLLNDATILFRDMAGDAASKAAHRVQPTEEELSQIDRPAEDNVWHDAPNFSKENIKARFQEEKNRNKPISRDEVKDVAQNATQTTHPQDSADPLDASRRAYNDQRYGSDSGVDARGGIKAAVNDAKERAQQNIPEEHQDRAKRQWGRTKDYWGEKMPEERRRQTVYRLKKMVTEIQGHQDYQRAIDTLLRLAGSYTGHGKAAVAEGRGQVQGAHQDDHLTQAENHLKTLIERFANYTSLDDLIDSINDIYHDADRDPELKGWFRSMDSYIRRCLKQSGYIMTDDATREWDQLNDHGHFLFRDRYRDHTDRVINELKFIIEQFSDDPDSRRLRNSMQKLFTDLGNDENGKPVFKKHLVKDLTQVIIPAIFENIRYVPIPRIEYSDPSIDAVVENLIIESDNLMPNVLEIGNDSYLRWGRKSISNKYKQQFMVSVSGIQCDLRDVSYYIHRKQGFPSITDTGVADIFLGGDGLSFRLQLATPKKLTTRAHFFVVDKCDVIIRNMSIKLKQSNHKVLFAIVKPLLLKLMRPAITKVIEKQIKDYFSNLDAIAYRVYQEQERAKQQVKNDPESAPNVYARYYQAIQSELTRKKEQAQEKAEQVAADKKVNVAMTKNDSIFKNISLPGGISTKATEYRNLAARGDKWTSDVFSIGSATESRDIPRPNPVTRKSPFRHQKPQVRDRTEASTAGYTSRASRDSGYHGLEPSALGSNLAKTNEYGTPQSKTQGTYTLNAPIGGANPMVNHPGGTNTRMPTATTTTTTYYT